MRKTKLLLVAFLAMLGSSVSAAEYEIGQTFTSIDELDGQLFAVVDESTSTAMGFGIPNHGNGWDMYFGTYNEAYASNACYLKIEEASEGYCYLHTYNSDGNLFNISWASGGYFNSQKADLNVCFALGKDQDGENLSVWSIEVSGGKFALKNKGTGQYLHNDSKPANHEDPFYFTFCTLKETEASIVERYKARYDEIKPLIVALDDDTTIFTGDATVDTSDADAALAAATTVDEVDAAIAKLYDAATTFVTSVTVNEGSYFDLSNIWIVNPSVRQNIDGWTIENLSATGGSAGVSNYNETEFYQRNFDFFQTLTLPKGTYEFGVTGFHRAGNHSTYFYAGEDKVLIPGVEASVVNSMAAAQTYFDDGNGKVSMKFALEEESNTIKIGIENNDTETDKWTIFRDFTLHYYGSVCDYSVYTERWAELVDEGSRAISNNPNVTGEEYTDLEAALSDAPDESAKKADYIAKINALEAAINTFNAAISSYDAYEAYRAETENLFGSDLGVASPSNAAEAAAAVQELNIAQYNKVASDYTYSLSGLIGDFGSWVGTATVAGEPATPNYLDYEHWSGKTHAYYEQASNGWGNAAGWTIQYEKTCTLPAGDYVIKVAARSSAGTASLVSCTATDKTVTLPSFGNTARGINTAGEASWSDEDEFVNNGKGFGWQWRFLPFTLSAQTEVTMTFYAEATTQYQWMSIADGELLSANDIATVVEYNETVDNTIEDEMVANVTINRTIKDGFNTIVLPFDATANQVAEAFGDGTEVFNFSENSEDPAAAVVNFTKGDGSISANKPVLIGGASESFSQEFKGVKIVAASSAVVEGANYDFVGTYAPIPVIATGNYFIGDGYVWGSKGGTSLNAFRAFIQPKSAEARIAKFYIDGVETTGIEGVAAAVSANNNNKIYNLAGQQVKKAQKGLYIQNGKKVVVK